MHFQTLINCVEVASSKRNRSGHFYDFSYQKGDPNFFLSIYFFLRQIKSKAEAKQSKLFFLNLQQFRF